MEKCDAGQHAVFHRDDFAFRYRRTGSAAMAHAACHMGDHSVFPMSLDMRPIACMAALAAIPFFSAHAREPDYKPGIYDTQGAIFDAVSGFRTFNGKPLIWLLRAHGLEIVEVDVNTVESLGVREGDLPGDVVYDISITGTANSRMPCDMAGLHGTSGMPYIEEFIRRHGYFPLLSATLPSPTGKLLYWAATGKCLPDD